MHRTLIPATICLLLFATCASAQKAKGKGAKETANYEALDRLDDTSKQVLLGFAAQYDSAVFLESTGGYADQPELNGFGFKKENVYLLKARGNWVVIDQRGRLHIDTTFGNRVSEDSTILRAHTINFAKLVSLNPDSLYDKEVVCCDIPYITLWLMRGEQYVLKSRQIWFAGNTRDKKVFSDAVEELFKLIYDDKN